MARKKKVVVEEVPVEEVVTGEEVEAVVEEAVVTDEPVVEASSEVKEEETPEAPVEESVPEEPIAEVEDEKALPEETPPEVNEKEELPAEGDAVELSEKIDNWEDVTALIKHKATIGTKIEAIRLCNFIPAKLLIAILDDYKKAVVANPSIPNGAKENTKLYNTIYSVINEKDDAIFKIKFDLVNFYFLNENKADDSVFVQFKLNRYSEAQKTLSNDQINTYHILNEIICSLADASTRVKEAKLLSGFTGDRTVLNDVAVNRIRNYYGMDS